MIVTDEALPKAHPRKLPDAPPARFYVTGGTVPNGASSYVTRQADADLIERLRVGEFCYVLNTRQMGKSSLMVRVASQLRSEGVAVAVIDLTAIGQNLTAEQWYVGLLCEIGEQLDIEDAIEDFLDENGGIGPLQRFMAALRQVVLPQTNHRPVVLFVDEIDSVRSLSFSTDEFFAAIRECFNRRTTDPEMNRLTFCLLGVATPADLIRDVRTTPFNIGRRVELTDFTVEEAAPLARGMTGLGRDGRQLLRRVLYWTNGHPYLTQRLCQAIASERHIKSPLQVDRLCLALFLSKKARETDDNLAFVRNRMLQSEVDLFDLLNLYSRIWKRVPLPFSQGEDIRNDDSNPLIAVLLLAGVVRTTAQSNGSLRIRNRIYRAVFDLSWADMSFPDGELRRQRTAVRRAQLQVGSVAGCIVLLIAWLAITAYRETMKARMTSEESNRLLYIADMNLAQQALDSGNVARVSQLLDNVKTNTDKGFESRYLNRLCHLEMWMPRHTIPDVTAMAFSPDGNKLAIGSGAGNFYIVDPIKETIMSGITCRYPSLIQYFPDGRHIFVDGNVFNMSDSSLVRPAPPTSFSKFIASSQDMSRFASCQRGVGSQVWDANTVKPVLHVPSVADSEYSIALSHNGKLLALGTGAKWVEIWDSPSKSTCRFVRVALPYISYLSFVGGRDEILTVSAGDEQQGSIAELWDVKGQSRLARFRVMGDVFSLSPNGMTLAVATSHGKVALWSLPDQKKQFMILTNVSRVTGLRFSPDSHLLATASEDGQVKVWNAMSSDTVQHLSDSEIGPGKQTLSVNTTVLPATASSADGKNMVRCGSEESKVYTACSEPDTRPKAPRVAQDNCAEPSGNLYMAPSLGPSDPDSKMPRPLKNIVCVDFSPDGSKIVTGNKYGDVTLWDTQDQKFILPLIGHDEQIVSVTYSPDGKRIATSSMDGTVRLWDSSTGEQTYSFSIPSSEIGRVALFSFDGSSLILAKMAGGSDEGATTVYSCKSATRQELATAARKAIEDYNRRHVAWN